MAFQISPNVVVTEKDLTTIIPAVSTTVGAYVGYFAWGPVDDPILIGNENELREAFGEPVPANKDTGDGVVLGNASSWFTAANFLGYGDNLRVVRVVETDEVSGEKYPARNAGNDGKYVLIKNTESYEAFTNTNNAYVVAKYPGSIGNSLRISMADYATFENISLTGTVSCAASSDQLAGAGTAFLTELYVGAQVTADGQTVTIASIQSNTAATLTEEVATEISSSSTAVLAEWEFADYFDDTPATSDHVSTRGGSNDEVHVVVVDELGKFTGIAGTILETHSFLSKAIDARGPQGGSIYWKQVLEGSEYVWVLEDVFAELNTTDPQDSTHDFADMALTLPYDETLSGGQDGSRPTSGDIIGTGGNSGWDIFSDVETSSDVNLLIAPPLWENTGDTIARGIIDIAEARKDCVAFISPEWADVPPGGSTNPTADIVAFRDEINMSTSYAVLDSGWKYQYDKYNDNYIWVPLCGDVAGLCARTDEVADPWFSPAGYNRGQIRGVVRLAYNPTKTQRDDLYKKGINPVVNFSGEGAVLYGDKTLLARPSAFDRINVRRLFIVLEKAIATASKYSLFEFNDEFTRASFVNMVEPYLRDVQGRRGITDYKVVCDETNNTGEVIDRNEFIADIYIKPARSINYIYLNFIATRTGVAFEEIVGQA